MGPSPLGQRDVIRHSPRFQPILHSHEFRYVDPAAHGVVWAGPEFRVELAVGPFDGPGVGQDGASAYVLCSSFEVCRYGDVGR